MKITREEYRQIIVMISNTKAIKSDTQRMIDKEGDYKDLTVFDMDQAMILNKKAKDQLRMLEAVRDDKQFDKYKQELIANKNITLT